MALREVLENGAGITDSPDAIRHIDRAMWMATITARLHVWAVTVLAGFLWTWAVLHTSGWPQIASAGIATATVLFPILIYHHKGGGR